MNHSIIKHNQPSPTRYHMVPCWCPQAVQPTEFPFWNPTILGSRLLPLMVEMYPPSISTLPHAEEPWRWIHICPMFHTISTPFHMLLPKLDPFKANDPDPSKTGSRSACLELRGLFKSSVAVPLSPDPITQFVAGGCEHDIAMNRSLLSSSKGPGKIDWTGSVASLPWLEVINILRIPRILD